MERSEISIFDDALNPSTQLCPSILVLLCLPCPRQALHRFGNVSSERVQAPAVRKEKVRKDQTRFFMTWTVLRAIECRLLRPASQKKRKGVDDNSCDAMRLDSLPLVPHCLVLSMHLWILRKRGTREREWGREGGVDNTPVVFRCEVYAAQNFALGVLLYRNGFLTRCCRGRPRHPGRQ